MRFTCEKNMLVTGLNIAGRTVAQKSALSVIEGILCKAGMKLSLTGYNMETAITYDIDADVSDPGECILPARLFSDIVKKLPEGPVTVVVDDSFKVSIRAGPSTPASNSRSPTTALPPWRWMASAWPGGPTTPRRAPAGR